MWRRDYFPESGIIAARLEPPEALRKKTQGEKIVASPELSEADKFE
jgi:hypothetical protein